ncbi:DUF4468 domain-containing protein [Mycovorax composti]|uniref:DUF4468 domain-containing protein n=1 Tax=Mycovorax composti TaxID=2962693 RepID=UPI00391FA3DF
MISTTAFGFTVKENEILIPFDSTSNSYAYIGVVEFDSSANYLYQKSKQWLIDKYLNNNFDLDNPKEKLIKKGSFDIVSTMNAGMGVKFPYNYTVNFSIVLEFKDGRYKYTLSNIKLSQNAEGTTTEQSIENFILSSDEMGLGKRKMEKFIVQTCNLIHEEFTQFIKEMNSAIQSNNNKNDW